MANPNTSFTNVTTTTWENRKKELADNLTASNVLWAELGRKGRIRTVSGGTKIEEPLMHGGPTAQAYSGSETLSTSDADMFTMAEFAWKQYAANATMTGLEKAQNSTADRLIDLYESKMAAAEASLINTLNADSYLDGTGSSSKTIGGLKLLVSDDGTGTVGGIVSGTYTFWKNSFYNGDTTTAANVQTQLNTLWASCQRGAGQGERPDVGLMGSTFWGFYMASLQTLQRFVDSKTAALGFQATDYLGTNMYLDNTCPTATHCFMLNTKYLSLRPHKEFNLKALPSRASGNQDVETTYLVWYGNMTVSNRARQGVLVGA